MQLQKCCTETFPYFPISETNVAWLFAIFLVVGVAGVVILLFLQEVPTVARMLAPSVIFC
jgi:hypothetical protein